MNPLIKWLLIGIGILLQVLLVAIVSIAVYKWQMDKQKRDVGPDPARPVVATMEFDEFKVNSKDKGLVTFKVALDVSSVEVLNFLGARKPHVREKIAKLVSNCEVEKAKTQFVKGELQDAVLTWVNGFVKENLPPEKTWFGFGPEKVQVVVKVVMFDFMALSVD